MICFIIPSQGLNLLGIIASLTSWWDVLDCIGLLLRRSQCVRGRTDWLAVSGKLNWWSAFPNFVCFFFKQFDFLCLVFLNFRFRQTPWLSVVLVCMPLLICLLIHEGRYESMFVCCPTMNKRRFVFRLPVIAGDGDSGSYGDVADTAMNLFCVLGFFVWWI